ncbi:MAG: hypothetical protein HY042_07185 [Spirochaetia bacterium]|nr:hypothetical protein [Spirochaetia bacterium]
MNKVSRRTFLERSGAIGAALTVPEWLTSCGTDHDAFSTGMNDPLLFARLNGITSPAMASVFCGITAPNPHNTQPWKIQIKSEKELLLFVDQTRLLPETDPPSRQIHIGQGTFIEHFVIGASQLGFAVDVEVLPDGEYGPRETGLKPAARLTLLPGKAKDSLYAEFGRRATNRTPYEGPALTEAEAQSVLDTIGRTHSRVDAILLSDPRSRQIRDLFIAASTVETNTLPKNDESRLWFRFNDSEIFNKRDGISLRGNGMSGLKYQLVTTFFLGRDQASWNSELARKSTIDIVSKAAESSQGFFSLKTRTNTMRDWILAGRDYARLQLALTKHNLVMQPMSQVLQEYQEMDALRTRFEELLGVRAPEKIQMFVRAGRSSAPFCISKTAEQPRSILSLRRREAGHRQ